MYIIDKNRIINLLKNLLCDVYAPIRLSDGTVTYGAINDGELVLDNILPIQSPKAILFPQNDEIISFDSGLPETVEKSKEPIYLFGVRSCDLGGLNYLDRFFCENFDFCDNYYYNRRMRSLIIALASDQPVENTFKTPEHKSSISEEGFDLQFIDLGNKYFVEFATKKGENFIINHKNFFYEASKDDFGQYIQAKIKAQENLPDDVPILEASLILLNNREPKDFWEKIADGCLECGGCSYSCPTCSCFNVYDLVYHEDNNLKSGIRCRSWDSCIFGGYTREASGHNHRQKLEDRVYRWYTHKLKTDIINFGYINCFGCGRCSSVCPGTAGMKSVVIQLVNKTIKIEPTSTC